MRNSPNMSYCAIENTSRAVNQVAEILQGVEGHKAALDLSRREADAWYELAEGMRDLLRKMDEAEERSEQGLDEFNQGIVDKYERKERDETDVGYESVPVLMALMALAERKLGEATEGVLDEEAELYWGDIGGEAEFTLDQRKENS